MINLSPGIVGAVIYLISVIRKYRICVDDYLREYPNTQGTKTSDVLELAITCGLILSYDGFLYLTKIGNALIEGESSEIDIKRRILLEYIRNVQPSWASLLVKGRFESVPFYDNDIKTCFFDAFLMNKPPIPSVIEWWDCVSQIIYGQRGEAKTSIGRKGEYLSIRYEIQRTGKTAEWQAIESNKLGYDLLSIVGKQIETPLLVEVKASNTLFQSSLAYITRHEWETAQRSQNYCFHFWSLYGKPKLAVLEKEDIKKHLPVNAGKGHWETVSINYNVFKRKFIEIPDYNIV